MNIKNIFIYVFCPAYFILGLYLSINIGISHDEFHENFNWKINISAIKDIFQNYNNDILLDYKDRYHGIAFNWLSQPIQILIHKPIASYLDIGTFGGLLISKHVVVFSVFCLSGIFIYLICNLLLNNESFSILSTTIYLLYPYLFGHALFNPKDIPFLSIWLICTYLIIRFIKKLFESKYISKRFIFIFALLTALLISIRIVGLIIFLQYLIFILVFLDNKKINLLDFFKENLKNFFLFSFLTILFIYILNPIFWLNPLEIINSIKWMGNYNQDLCTLTLGNCMSSLNLPSSYYFIWFFFKLPIIILIGLFLFPVIEKKFLKNSFLKIIVFSLLITIFSILILFILKNVSLYDEIRHIMFLIPLIILVGLINIYLFNKKLFFIAGSILVFFFITENILLNPYQYTWLNPISKFYNIKKNFELDYWGVSNKNLQKKIREHYEKDSSIDSNCVYGDLYSNIFLEKHGFKCFKNYSELDSAKKRPFYVYKNVRNVKRSDPKDCELIWDENYKYTLSKKEISVGTAWFCD